MSPLVEVGKEYEFETVTWYIRGRVTHLYPTHAQLEHAYKVYDTGAAGGYYGKGAAKEEPLPDGTLVQLSACILIAPWASIVVR